MKMYKTPSTEWKLFINGDFIRTEVSKGRSVSNSEKKKDASIQRVMFIEREKLI